MTELHHDKSSAVRFTPGVKEFEAVPGYFHGSKTYPFEFNVEKPYESYGGMNVSLRYFIQVTISRSYGTVIEKRDFAVHNFLTVANEAIESDNPKEGIRMEVGIEDCLHIEFEFDKQKYHLQVSLFFKETIFAFALITLFLRFV